MTCCICGPVKNCGPYLEKVFENIEKIGSLFSNYKILIYYDVSTDDTLEKLKNYQKQNNKLFFYVNKIPTSKYRTHRLANARNFCLNYIRRNQALFPLFIMMDFDDVNCKNINIDVLKKNLFEKDRFNKWDALTFNTHPAYYDIWALSLKPYCFSYNHFETTETNNYHAIQNYVSKKLESVKSGEFLRCISAFNGFAVYKTNKFINSSYDGRIRIDLLPPHYLKLHQDHAKSNIILKDYGNVNGNREDCEHRAFHITAINKNNARIMISPEILFS